MGRETLRLRRHVHGDATPQAYNESHARKTNIIVGMLMVEDNEADEGNDEDEDDGSIGSIEARPEIALADSYFDADELEWIKAHYGDSVVIHVQQWAQVSQS